MDLFEFLSALSRSCIEALRRNKIPACLSVGTLVLTTALALTGDFDERPRYRKFILPEIANAENQFMEAMREAEQETSEPLRSLYFLEGHRRAKAVLGVLR